LIHVKSFKTAAAKVAVGTAAASVAVVGVGSAAWAAPTNAKNATPVTAICGPNNTQYSLVVNGGGNGANSNSGQTFNAAHFTITSDSVFVPTSFGESTFTQTIHTPNGPVTQTINQPPTAKGNGSVTGPANATTLSCTYSFGQSYTDPTTGYLITFEGSGSVVGFVPGSQSGAK
jgi:hypothetical protein